MKSATDEQYHARRIVITFDVRMPGASERLHRELAAWREAADIEMLGRDHVILKVRPGLVWERAV